MASLRKKDRSPFWFACYTLPDGRRTQRSTGTPDKRKALGLALKYEDAAREAGAGRFIEARARRVIADIYALANAEVLPNSSNTSGTRPTPTSRKSRRRMLPVSATPLRSVLPSVRPI